MKPFQRSDDLLGKMFVDALDREVHLDQPLRCVAEGRKTRVFCSSLNSYIQFPTALRSWGATYTADVIKCGGNGRRVFYRAYKGSIRDWEGRVVG